MDSGSDTGPEIRVTEVPAPTTAHAATAATAAKREREENPVEQGRFSIGIYYGSSCRKRLRRTISPKSGRRRIANRMQQRPQQQPPTTPSPEAQANRLAFYCRTLMNVNPLVARERYIARIYAKPAPFKLIVPTAPLEIRYLYPYRNTVLNNEWVAHMYIQYFRGKHIDWCMKFADLQGSRIRPTSTFEFKPLTPSPFVMTTDIIKATQWLFEQNQVLRWAMKNLLRLWLLRKALRRSIGADTDMITMEAIPPEEQCRVVCMQTRSVYVFSGNTLLKTMKSNIECQVGGIPETKAPKNPFTNLPFTYGQMLELYNQLMAWCAKRCRPFPTSLSLYRETAFRPLLMLKLHHNYLQYRATIASFMDDDPSGASFLENLDTVLESYSYAMPNYDDRIMSTPQFAAWIKRDPNHYLIRAWRLIVADYWYYEQTNHLARSHWLSELSIIRDIDILLKASEIHLRGLVRSATPPPFLQGN